MMIDQTRVWTEALSLEITLLNFWFSYFSNMQTKLIKVFMIWNDKGDRKDSSFPKEQA